MRRFFLALAWPGSRPGPSGPLTQVRHKSNSKSGRKGDNGVLVRLLRNIPKFGRKGKEWRQEKSQEEDDWLTSSK